MIEKKLGDAPLLEPSAALDRKIHSLIQDSAHCRRNLFWRPVPLWTSVAACVAFALLGLCADRWIRTSPPRSEPEPVLIYVVEPTEGLRNLVHAKDKSTSTGFFQTKKSNIQIITPSSKRSESLSF
jgi:hypothetical protein